ncbi:MAG: hypothetical protein F2563_02365 [Actinobacteria bacterium]|nr:hypothetical protein [Actinomycetota bacterium]
MTEYDNTNTGAAFKSDKYDSYSGTLNVEGKEYWVSVYDKKKDGSPNTDKNGMPWFRITVKPKEFKTNDEPF